MENNNPNEPKHVYEDKKSQMTILIIVLGITVLFIAVIASKKWIVSNKPKILIDLSHGQFQDVFVDPSYYNFVLPGYKEICKELNAEYSEINSTITSKALEGVKTLVMISPLARSTQKPIKEEEKSAIISFIKEGGSLLIFVDEEEYRVSLKEYGANDITKKFGIEIGEDIEGIPGNCGAVSFSSKCLHGRRLAACFIC